MHLYTRNVNTAFQMMVGLFHVEQPHNSIIRSRPSRNGNVLMLDEPVTITYSHPKERVLFNQARDCNPFFHLYEALWMLAGRNDVAPLAYYASKMKDFSDDGETFNGAYGYRWRHAKYQEPDHYGKRFADQLDILVNHLKADPTSRRAVLQMWNVEDDLLKLGHYTPCVGGKEKACKAGKWVNRAGIAMLEEGANCPYCKGTGKLLKDFSKDVCCNLSVMFSIREAEGISTPADDFLDMTVTNRSNDMIWGMLGADFVDFSFLQEYVAARLGVEVGKYNHFTNNLHVYDWNWKPKEWLADKTGDMHYHYADWYDIKCPTRVPLIKDPAVFEQELPRFVETYSGESPSRTTWTDWSEPFFSHVAVPMMDVFYCYKRRKDPRAVGVMNLALSLCENIRADDWRVACVNWITKRMK